MSLILRIHMLNINSMRIEQLFVHKQINEVNHDILVDMLGREN